MKKGLIYYTNNNLDQRIFEVVINRLNKICANFEIISVSHQPIDFGYNIVMDLPNIEKSMVLQIYEALKISTADIVYFAEHDVLYHPSHFDFIPNTDRCFYNVNVWLLQKPTGKTLYLYGRRLSQLVVFKQLILHWYSQVMDRIAKGNYNRRPMAGAPGMHHLIEVDRISLKDFRSDIPNIDIRHDKNWTYLKEIDSSNWPSPRHSNAIVADEIPGWGKTLGRFDEFLEESNV